MCLDSPNSCHQSLMLNAVRSTDNPFRGSCQSIATQAHRSRARMIRRTDEDNLSSRLTGDMVHNS